MADTTPDTLDSNENENLFQTITLSRPFKRGELVIDKITLREPSSGELRGLKLQDLINTETDAILKVIPRISEPVLTPDECNKLRAADLAEIGGTIRGFFMNSAEREMMRMMIEAQRQKI
jgi:hypothetical protein